MSISYEEFCEYCYRNTAIDEKTQKLMRLVASGETTPRQLQEYFAGVNFERLNGQQVWMLAELAERLRFQGVPKELMPRVSGVLKLFAVKTARQLCQTQRLAHTLRQAGIDILLLKGAAMKTDYQKRHVRNMGDVDFLVRPQDFERAAALLKQEFGAFCVSSPFHLALNKDDVTMEMHRTFLKENIFTGDPPEIWTDAEELSLQGESVFVPGREAMLLLLLLNAFQDIVNGPEAASIQYLRWALDALCLLKDGAFHWEKLQRLTEQCGVAFQTHTMLLLLNRLFPGSVGESELALFPLGRQAMRMVPLLLKSAKYHNLFAETRKQGAKRAYLHSGLRYYRHHIRYLLGAPNFIVSALRFPSCFLRLMGCASLSSLRKLAKTRMQSLERAQ